MNTKASSVSNLNMADFKELYEDSITIKEKHLSKANDYKVSCIIRKLFIGEKEIYTETLTTDYSGKMPETAIGNFLKWINSNQNKQ